MNAAAPKPDELLRLRELVSALEDGNRELYETRLAQLLREREAGLFTCVARLTRQLHQALSNTELDGQLTTLAQDQLPDACSRLDYVVQLTENAAHQALDLVERSRTPLRAIEEVAAGLPAAPQNTLTHATGELRAQLSQLAQAQEYQDVSGQLIRRVIGLVRGVEGALLELLRSAGTLQIGSGTPIAAGPTRAAEAGLQGPAVPGLGSTTVSQQDADALLSSLGF